MNIYDSGYDNLKDHAQRYGIREVPEETGFVENFNATSEFFTQEMTSMSEQHMIGDQVSDAVKLYKNLNPNKKDDGLTKINLGDTKLSGGLGALEYNKQFLEDNHQAILDLQLQYPDAGLKTIDDIMAEAKEKARLTREKLSSTSANSSGVGKLGMVAGGIYGTFHDPVLLASMVIGSGKIKGPSKAANAWKAFKTEAAIGAGAEMLITPSVMSWRDKLDSPYSLKEATINILAVGGFAGVTRAGGSYVVDVFEARKAISSLRAAGKDGEADVVESYVEMQERGTGNMDAHLKAYEQAQISLQKGKIIEQAELDKITGGKVGIESIDPRTIEVDAKTFQFKSRGDDQGVTDALEGVNKWDPIKANTSIVWERLDGTRFIADGHQRLALAKRLIGDDAQEIGLNAFIMREADGYTAEAVRDIAAFKNIAEGTGSALDAAKVIRAGNSLSDDLPPNSALVRDARGLSKLDDESFRMVIDEKIDAKYGAIVGELIEDSAEQAAVIRALIKAKPENINQANIMVNDMKVAGFTKTKTQDLFEGMEVTESLFKERAKVIDNVMRQVKKDKSVFKTLAEQESRIAGAGNKLDRDANLTRLSDDEKTLATLTSLANTKGSVSDLINDAARRIKEGESVQRATSDILPELRRAGDEQLNVRANDVRSADGQPTLIPEKNKPVRLQDLNDTEVAKAENLFRNKQRQFIKSVDDIYGESNKIAIANQRALIRVGNKIEKKFGIKHSTPPQNKDANGKVIRGAAGQIKNPAGGRVAQKVRDKYEGDFWKLTDSVRTSFVLDSVSEAKQVINTLSKHFDVLDEGWSRKASGYIDRKVLVRFKDGRIGEIQIISKEMRRAKFDLGGHKIYEQWRTLFGKIKREKNTAKKAKLQKKADELEQKMLALYSDAIKASSRDWKDLSDKMVASVDTSATLTSRQSRPGADTENAVLDDPSSSITAGIPSHQANNSTSLKSNSAINQTSGHIITKDTNRIKLNDKLKDTGLDLDDPYLNELHAAELKQVDDLLLDADMEIPTGIKVVDGENVVEFRSAREVIKELDDESKVVDDMFKCMGE